MIGSSGAGTGPRGALHSYGTENDGIAFDPKIARRLLSFLRPYWKSMAIAVICMLLASALSLLAPYLLKVLVDTHIVGGDVDGILRISIILGGAYLTLYLVTMAQQYILSYTGQKVLRDLRSRLFLHLQHIHVGYHDTHLVGVTVSRVMNDVAVINELISQGLITVAGDFLRLVGIVGIMLLMSPLLALYTFAVIPLMILATYLFSRKAKRAYRQTRRSVAQVVGGLAEDISGMRVIQAFSQESRAREEFDGKNSENRDAHVRAMSLSFIFLPSVEFLGMLASAVVLWFGGHAVVAGTVSLGVVIAFLSYVTQFFQPIRELSQLFSTMQSAMAGGEQIFRLLDTEPAVQDPPSAPDMSAIVGHLELDHVRLSYTEGVEVLHGISLSVRPGTMVAFVGPTGAGKTSIANIIGRFYEISDGSVRIDGTDIRTVTQRSLHSQMAWVAQDPFLFSGSVRENIAFGKPDATDVAVTEAATRARAHEFISRLPQGYDTEIQEGAVNLSLGQRQLVSIARAILADPRILVMDEATSNVDTLTESRIQEGLQALFANRTSIVIAHRLSTILHADQIFVIDEGRVAEQGTHDELVGRGGTYASLYRRQFVDLEAQ